MRYDIKRILKEEVNNKENYERKILSYMMRSGINANSNYKDVLHFLKSTLGITGMEAWEFFQLMKDNWRDIEGSDELIRTDISKRKVRTANIRGRELVQNKIPFKGNNTHGEYVRGSYVVYSYGWYPVFVFKDGQWFENENRYSVSTAKQMSQLRPFNQGEIISTSTEKLKDIINR